MATLLAKNAEILVTMDGQRRELKNAGVYVEDRFIKQVGRNEELPATADTVLDLSGQIVLPGFVNAHHHLNQTLTRNTSGGACVLGRSDIGSLEPGNAPTFSHWICTTSGTPARCTIRSLPPSSTPRKAPNLPSLTAGSSCETVKLSRWR
jgi:hypothetical protein